MSGESRREYYYANDTGDTRIVVYPLFPGVEAAYISVHMRHFDFAEAKRGDRDRYVGFHYCRKGRIEQEADDEFFYLMPGDCSVVIRDRPIKKFSLPLRHYHGISISVDTDIAPKKCAAVLDNAEITPMRVAEKLCGGQHSTVLRSVGQLKHIFAESYAVDESLRTEYLKVKLLELLCVLHQIARTGPENACESVPRTQAELVHQVSEYIFCHIHAKLTIDALSRHFGVSDTCLQSSFHAVYGMSVVSFIRAQMQYAAQVLIHLTVVYTLVYTPIKEGCTMARIYGKIQKWGNSHGLRIPQAALIAARLQENDEIEIITDKEEIILRKLRRLKTLDELFANYNGEYKPEEAATGAAVGMEVFN